MKTICRLALVLTTWLGCALPSSLPAATYTDGAATFTVTFASPPGEYAPRVDAFWVTDASGRLVQNVRRDAANRGNYLYQWIAARNGWTQVDGFTGATISSWGTITVTWDCRDTNNIVVPDGSYRFYVEFTDRNSQGWWTTNGCSFVKGLAPLTNTYPNQQYLSGLTVTYDSILDYDVAVTGISPPFAMTNTVVTVTVSVTNKTSVPETFTLALNNITTGTPLGSRDLALAGNTASNVTFTWNTAGLDVGPQTLRATASVVSNEVNTADNTLSRVVTLRAPTHDVALTAVSVPTQVPPNVRTNVTVVVTNIGDLAESFAVTLTDETDGQAIGSNQVSSLAPLAGASLTFSWNTTNATLGAHLLRATAAPVAGETALANNAFEALTAVMPLPVTNTYLTKSNYWRYNDTGTNLGTAWRTTNYSDSAWARGRGPLGYGDAPTNTVLSYGTNSATKHPTYYFRTNFHIATLPTSMIMRLRRDDGAVVYHNGVEIYRVNITNNPVNYSHWASAVVTGTAETTYYETNLTATNAVLGENLLAVEVHQESPDSSDVSFDLELLGVVQSVVPLHDVAIHSLAVPARVLPGTRTNVTVTLTNKGTFVESFAVELTDDTDALSLGVRQITDLAANAAATVVYQWDIPSAPWLPHTLRAVAGPLSSEVIRSDNTNIAVVLVYPLMETNVLISRSNLWRFSDTGSDLTLSTWKQLDYYDAPWGLGRGPLGYGDPVTATNSFGSDANNKFPTYYYRKTFNVDVLPSLMVLRLRCDDGAVVYHNGVEVHRVNLTNDPVAYAHWASAGVDGADETTYFQSDLAAINAVVGTNVLAVEVHQLGPANNDLSFDLELLGLNPLTHRVHDVAALELKPQDNAAVGDQLRLAVTVTNRGNASETFTVYIRDTNNNQIVASATVTNLAVGAAATVLFNWRTLGATAGNHALRAFTVLGQQTNSAGLVTASLLPAGFGLRAAGALGSLGGRCAAVAATNNLAVLGAGATLEIWNIANPSAPSKLGQVRLPGLIEHIILSGSYAYVACGAAGVQFVDLSAPAAPVHRNTYDTSGHARGLAAGGGFLYVADGVSGLRVLSITTPSNPTLAGVYYTEGPAQAVALSGSRAYVLDGHRGLLILNVANPLSPSLLGAYSGFDAGQAVAVSGSYAYVVDANNHFFVVNVSTPASPTLAGSLLLTNMVGQALSLGPNTAYVPAGDSGLLVLNITTPSAPAFARVLATPGQVVGAALAGSTLVLADGFWGFQTYNVTTPANPLLQADVPTAIRASDTVVNGPLAYVAAGERGLRIYDVSNPNAPTLTGWFAGATNARCVAVTGTTAYVGDGQYGLKIVNVANPAAPAPVGAWSGPDLASIRDIGVNGSLVVATDGRAVCLFDAATPANPTLQATYSAPAFAFDMAVSDARAYLACGNAGLVILDLSPAALTERSVTDTPGLASGVSVAGATAYVADGPGGWLIFDIANPAAPTLVKSSLDQGPVFDVAVAGVLATLGSGASAATTMDVTSPLTPVPKRSFNALVRALRLTASGGAAYVAEDEAGLVILATGDDTDADGLPDSWEQQIIDANPNDNIRTLADASPTGDFDQDGASNEAEYVAGTLPADPASRFAQLVPVSSGASTFDLRWHSVAGKTYTVWKSTDLAAGPAGFVLVQDNIPATPPLNTLPITNDGQPAFYLISVR